jgi:hypothetical protein
MTDAELDAIDAEVARHVMGWTLADRVKWGWGSGPPMYLTDNDNNPTHQGFQPSRNWSAMGEVVEKMRADGYGWSFESMNNLQYRAEFAPGNYGTDAEEYRSIQDYLPLAVCLAALAAVGKPWKPKP